MKKTPTNEGGRVKNGINVYAIIISLLVGAITVLIGVGVGELKEVRKKYENVSDRIYVNDRGCSKELATVCLRVDHLEEDVRQLERGNRRQ
jgi:hypothetical protein